MKPNESNSLNLTMSEFQSQDIVAMKVKTFTVDNTTPFSKVKRKLVDICDLEDDSRVRDKKLHASVYEESKLDVFSKTPLIVPKVEKF
ncbi:hypothetical protein E3N88_12172 [Mikania micrantha]|uniref:Uncharacterized protein n=1 Tax=Mikania micrantha TaxID=192012 RepID=A0A5N6P6R7_9ASTR|nr:hypothetical protein E3N88_12172 [Mikania micrantha]